MTDDNTALFKIAAAAIIFACALVGARASRSLRDRNSGRWLSVGNCFAGGIFIGAGLIHTLADSQSLFDTLLPNTDFPIWSAIAAFSIITLMTIDRSLSALAKKPDTERAVGGFTLFVVLSLHSVLAGMALGVEPHPVQGLAILIAIIAHKGSAAFALGLRTHDAHYWRTMASFSLMTPAGVLLGTALTFSLQNDAKLYFEAVFDAIAAGTFLYVALSDILPREFSASKEPQDPGRALTLSLAVLTGLALMSILALYT